ncbi:hypothetical protein QAD02_014155 [Eretmocerus hayati]|uniref:Uncharacterized protein n=1 Tax=Eretmocerus hayati TaxID=131215 RepID=A0ACC2P4H3_9HYME|nr:hypothetical protein QAD02_014155 [Eretmocerus hayati]
MDAEEANLLNTWVCDTLTSWGLRKLIPDFERNDITKDIFFKLNETTIDKLIPSIGLNILFKEKLDQLKNFLDINGNSHKDEDETIHPQNNDSSNEDNFGLPMRIIMELDNFAENQNPTDNNPKLDNDLNIQTRVTGASANSTTSRYLTYEEFCFILDSTIYGKLLHANYKRTGRIDKSYLTKALMPSILVKNPNYRLNKQDWDVILSHMKKYSPDEKLTSFYAAKTGSTKSTSGCWYNWYRTVTNDLKKEGLIDFDADDEPAPKKKRNVPNLNQNEEDASEGVFDEDEDMETLQNEFGDKEKMFPIWKRTLAPRSLLDNDIDVEGQIARYKPLQQSYGYELASLVFIFLVKMHDLIGSFGKLWPEVAHLIVKIAEEDSRCMDAKKFYQENKYLVQEGKESLLGLLLLPLVEETKNVKAKWRPTKNEVKDGFILHLQTLDDFKQKQEKKMETYRSHGCKSIQPYVVLVGSLHKPDSCWIQINNYQYVVKDPLDAVESCFKLFFALNADYPPECKHVWTFIQEHIFKMKSQDVIAPVDNLIRALDVKKNEIQNKSRRSRQK